ncbi:MAG: phage baseplate assembly protein V [Roseitalea sp.]|nr:phage baseplate assembly protein V [Roseitalea sp.]MBO6950984.1 phage baseplate assembly protein V [Rhizobiaceae bacterium]MBO6591029.1 phage baseplate assembly protein V [Roseitalea sp.]MBO6599713.1 phage baseplate assembly protein V [Roseitalea sp.]MBO6611469.1 phage baseplate assembly protein V [Roseitalea sp.]
MADLADLIAGLFDRVTDLERRVEISHRDGKVAELDAAKGLVRVDYGTDKSPAISEWVPWVERAGAQKSWNPPAVGEAVSLVAPGGEMALARAVPGGFSADFPAPSDEAGARVDEVGSTKTTMRDGQFVLDALRADLGGEGGKPVARIGDRIEITEGSSAGFWPIVEGSGTVFAVD